MIQPYSSGFSLPDYETSSATSWDVSWFITPPTIADTDIRFMYHSYSYYPPCMFDPAGVMVSDVSSICQRSKEAKGHDGMGV